MLASTACRRAALPPRPLPAGCATVLTAGSAKLCSCVGPPRACQVDSAILAAWSSFTANRAAVGAAAQHARAASLEQLAAARQAYLSRLEGSLTFVREQGLQGSAKVGPGGAAGGLHGAADARKQRA